MWDCESALRGFAQRIEPTIDQKKAASRSHRHLKTLLKSGQFETRIMGAYLSGSYARDTAIGPIDDVDVVIVIDPAGWHSRFWDGRPDPEGILQSFARAIRYRYHDSPVYIQRRSVCLQLHHLAIDVVPGIEVDGNQHQILLPDTEAGEWITSAPKLHTAIATDINQINGGRFKPVVKLLKYWHSQLPETARLKSFAIETLAATLFRNISLLSLQEGLRCFFDFVAALDDQAILYSWPNHFGIHMSWWSHELPDLAGSGSNLVAKVSAEKRKKFLKHAIRSRDVLIQAEKARDADSSVRYLETALRLA